jgi:hypothetical protein
MRKQILPLPHCEAQPPWPSSVRAQGTLRGRSPERPLLYADIAGQFLDRSHSPTIGHLYVRYRHEYVTISK